MAKYLDDAMEIMEKIKANRRAAQSGGGKTAELQTGNLPWPGYNGGLQFRCECGVCFDTSAGMAKHKVYECRETNR